MIKRSTLTFGSLLILCLQVFTQTITITPAAPVSFCTGDSVTLVAQVSGGGYGTDSYSFQVVPFHAEMPFPAKAPYTRLPTAARLCDWLVLS